MADIDEILLTASPGEIRAALLEEGRVVEFIIDRGESAPGDQLTGRIRSINRGLNAAFVDIGEAELGFLKRAEGLAEGELVIAAVVAAARPGKGAVLKRLDNPADIRPRRHLLERLLERHHGVRRVLTDQPELAALSPKVEIHRGGKLFATSDAEDLLEAALSPVVELPRGGRLIIEAAAGLTVIDIDSGGGTPLEANLAAIPEIARQLRLRGLAGHVMVDLIPLRDRLARNKLVEALRQAVAADPTPTKVVGVTPLGLVELTRERRRPSLAESMLAPALPRRSATTIGLEALRALLDEATARPAAALALALSPEAAATLRRHPTALAEAATRLGRPVQLDDRPGLDGFLVIEVTR